MRTFTLLFAAVGLIVGPLAMASMPISDSYYYDKLFDKQVTLIPKTDELVILYEESASEETMASVARPYGLEPVHPANERLHIGVYRLPKGVISDDFGTMIEADPLVAKTGYPYVDQEGYIRYAVPGLFTVRFHPEIGEECMLQIIAEHGCEVACRQWTPGYYRLRAPEGGSVFEMIREFTALDDVQFSELSIISYDGYLYAPNDSLYPDQWSLDNTGQFEGCPCPDADIDADQAWDIVKGDEEVIIVIIDTGVDLDHPDLVDNLLPRGDEDWDFSDGPSKIPEDDQGHGTRCAGIAAAVADNHVGVAGVAYGCRIMPLKVDLREGYNENRADAINYASSRRHEFKGLVMSCSWFLSSGDFTAVHQAIVDAEANDCVLCFAGGNSGEIRYPAKYEETICVGATSPCDEHKDSGTCDGEEWESGVGDELDVVAPGVLVPTTLIGGGYHVKSGTSASTPHTAGVCALIWSTDPSLTNDEVRSVLESTAEDMVGDPGEDVEGWDPYMGWGRINASLAVSSLATRVTVTVTPDATIVERGGTLGYTVAVTNNSESSVSFDYWTDIILWNGKPYGKNPILGPKSVTLASGQTRQKHVGHKVPASAPLKTYTCCGRVGQHPHALWDEDCFSFTVVERLQSTKE